MLIYNILFFLQILLATCSKVYLNHTKLIEPLDNKIRSLNYSGKFELEPEYYNLILILYFC